MGTFGTAPSRNFIERCQLFRDSHRQPHEVAPADRENMLLGVNSKSGIRRLQSNTEAGCLSRSGLMFYQGRHSLAPEGGEEREEISQSLLAESLQEAQISWAHPPVISRRPTEDQEQRKCGGAGVGRPKCKV